MPCGDLYWLMHEPCHAWWGFTLIDTFMNLVMPGGIYSDWCMNLVMPGGIYIDWCMNFVIPGSDLHWLMHEPCHAWWAFTLIDAWTLSCLLGIYSDAWTLSCLVGIVGWAPKPGLTHLSLVWSPWPSVVLCVHYQ